MTFWRVVQEVRVYVGRQYEDFGVKHNDITLPIDVDR